MDEVFAGNGGYGVGYGSDTHRCFWSGRTCRLGIGGGQPPPEAHSCQTGRGYRSQFPPHSLRNYACPPGLCIAVRGKEADMLTIPPFIIVYLLNLFGNLKTVVIIDNIYDGHLNIAHAVRAFIIVHIIPKADKPNIELQKRLSIKLSASL